jgi:hypothetical protein
VGVRLVAKEVEEVTETILHSLKDPQPLKILSLSTIKANIEQITNAIELEL